MKISSPNRVISILGIVCTAFGHNYKITREVTNHINEYKCTHCGREVTDNILGNLEILTGKVKEVNTTVSSFLEKRSLRVSAQSA
jgi:hypothetical protein